MSKVLGLTAPAEEATDLYTSISSTNKTNVTNSMKLTHNIIFRLQWLQRH
jgi:hypothetical protein